MFHDSSDFRVSCLRYRRTREPLSQHLLRCRILVIPINDDLAQSLFYPAVITLCLPSFLLLGVTGLRPADNWTWSRPSISLPTTPRAWHSATAVGQRLLVFGGERTQAHGNSMKTTSFNDVSVFDTGTCKGFHGRIL